MFYLNPTRTDKKSAITRDVVDVKDLANGVVEIINQHHHQLNCSHVFEYRKDTYGVIFSDGRGVCKHCELEHPSALPKLTGSVVSMSMGEDDIMALMNWPEDCYLQGGSDGIVLQRKSKDSYTTAFFEAFPKLSGISTFIRGEGSTIQEAEKKCFDQYLKMAQCSSHEWTRKIRGKVRVDGYAQCTKCLFEGKALAPTTTCVICDTPTSIKIEEEYYCPEHFAEIPFETIFNARKKQNKSGFFNREEREDELAFDCYLKHCLTAFFIREIGSSRYEDYESRCDYLISLFARQYLTIHFGCGLLQKPDKFPEPYDLALDKAISTFTSNKAILLDYIFYGKSFKFSEVMEDKPD